MNRALLTLFFASVLTPTTTAHADLFFDSDDHDVGSPQDFAWEFRVGVYQPDIDIFDGQAESAFTTLFGDDQGPLIGTEFHYFPLRIPYVGQLGVGVGFGWVRYEAGAILDDGTRSDEQTKLVLFPLNAMGVLRIDVLAREVGIPLVLVGKVGADFVPWYSETGGTREGSGVSVGLRWAGQLAIELDFIEPRGARRMDDEYGINHVFIFGEIYGSMAAANSIRLGTPWTWTAGMGFAF